MSPRNHGKEEEDYPDADGNDNDFDMKMSDSDEPLTQDVSHKMARAGIIKKLTLVNWLCFNHFHVDFGRNVNFIAGRNGSGKSAILQGLCVALGIRARGTNRVKNLRQMIRDGKDVAILTVEIHNRGPDALPNCGDVVIIERRLHRNGRPGYFKVKNEYGTFQKVTSRRIMEIMDHFNIQIDNPCVVLNQDMARDFLQSSDPRKLYELFLRSAMLRDMRETLDECEDQTDEMRRLIEPRKNELPLLEAKMDEAKTELNEAEDIRQLGTRMREVQVAMLWAVLREGESAVANLEGQREHDERKVGSLGAKVVGETEKVDALAQQKATAHEALSNTQARSTEFTTELRALVNHLKTARRDARNVATQRAEDQRRRAQIIRRKRNAERRLEEIEQKAASEAGEEEHRLEEMLRQKGEENMRVRQAESDAQARRRDLPDNSQLSEQISACDRDVQSAKARTSELQQRIKDLNRQRQNQVLRFGPKTVQILTAIKRQLNRFSRPPIGPLGRFVTVTDPSWTVAIENCLGTAMLGYVVSSHEDMLLMQAIFKRVIPRGQNWPRLYVQRFNDGQQRYNIGPNALAAEGLSRVIDVVDIRLPADNDSGQMNPNDAIWAFNTLVDQTHLETWVLRPSQQMGRDLLIGLRSRQPRVWISGVFLTDGSQVVDRNNRSIASFPTRMNFRVLSSDVGMDIINCQNELEQSGRSLEVHQRQLTKFRADLRAHKAALRRADTAVSQAAGAVRRVEAELRDLQEERDGLRGRQDELLEETREEITGHTSELTKIDEKTVEIDAVLAEKSEKVATLEHQKNEMKAEYDSFASEVEQARLGFESAIGKHLTRQRKLDILKRRHAEMKSALEGVSRELETKRIEVQRRNDQVSQFGPRDESDTRSKEVVRAELEELKTMKDIAQERLGGRSVADLSLAFTEAAKAFRQAQHEVSINELRLQELAYSRSLRANDWERFRRKIANLTENYFKLNLEKQNHSGELNFKHDMKELDMKVYIANSSQAAEGSQDTRGLSGGERSYATLSFVTALGESIAAPFRALDEYDIFMDSVNRRISTNLLLSLAEAHRHRQFIFMTPQDVSGITPTNEIRIHILPDPEHTNDQSVLQ
eukprot:182039_1